MSVDPEKCRPGTVWVPLQLYRPVGYGVDIGMRQSIGEKDNWELVVDEVYVEQLLTNALSSSNATSPAVVQESAVLFNH